MISARTPPAARRQNGESSSTRAAAFLIGKRAMFVAMARAKSLTGGQALLRYKL
jgi:hypothetical protein